MSKVPSLPNVAPLLQEEQWVSCRAETLPFVPAQLPPTVQVLVWTRHRLVRWNITGRRMRRTPPPKKAVLLKHPSNKGYRKLRLQLAAWAAKTVVV